MKNIGRKYFSRILMLVIGGIIIAPTFLTDSVYAQRTETYIVQGELNMDYILEKLRSPREPDQKKKNQLIINYIKKSKDSIQFVMTEDEEAQLREAGADDAFIAYIAKVSEDMLKKPIGNLLLGNKYIAIAQDNSKKEKERTNNVINVRYVKKDEAGAKQLETEAAQFEQVAQENANKAIPYYNQVKMLEADGSTQYTGIAYSNLAVAYSILKDFDKSVSYATLAIEAEPNSVRYFNRASLYDAKARSMQSSAQLTEKRAVHELAIKDCETALTLDSTMGPCKQMIAGIKSMWKMP